MAEVIGVMLFDIVDVEALLFSFLQTFKEDKEVIFKAMKSDIKVC